MTMFTVCRQSWHFRIMSTARHSARNLFHNNNIEALSKSKKSTECKQIAAQIPTMVAQNQ